MADDLVFPPSEDPFDDFGTNMLNDDVLSTDLLNIPHIVPPVILPNEERRVFNTAGSLATSSNTSYTPISQLMKQTEELVASLDGPLNNTMSEQSNYNAIHNNQLFINNLSNQMMTSTSTNFVNPSGPNTQCLVVGRRRIQIPTQQPNNAEVIRNAGLIKAINPSLPAVKDVNNPVEQLLQPSSKAISASINSISQPLDASATEVSTPLNNSLKTPGISMPIGAQNTRLKGQIMKNANQQLVFVTEVNGKRTCYLIHQTKQQGSGGGGQQQVNVQPVVHSNTVDTTMKQTQRSTLVDNTNNGQTLLDLTQDPEDEDDLDHSLLITNTKNENSSDQVPISKNINIINTVVSKKEHLQKIRDKLKNLPTNLKVKSALNITNMDTKTLGLKQLSPSVFNSQSTLQVIPASQMLMAPGNKMVNDFDSILMDTKLEPVEEQNMEVEEEDGQEIEFSENDITSDLNDDAFIDGGNKVVVNKCNDSDDENEDDEDDSLPLSQLKQENDEWLEEMKLSRHDSVEGADSVPLSVVAASLKKTTEKKGKTKGKKEKKKKDPREPIKPLRAYQLFFRDVQSDVRDKYPNLTFGELSSKVSHLWETLEAEKKKDYQDKQIAAKAEYDINLKKYNELLAREASSSLSQSSKFDTEDVEMKSDEESTPKKVVKRNVKRKKKSPSRPTSDIQQLSEEDLLAQVNDSDEIPIETIQDEPQKLKKMKVKKTAQQDDPPSSPSLPSSDSSSDEDDDSESAISRIRQKAAELKKKIKEEKKAQKHKSKEVVSKKPKLVLPKMHVETIMEKEEIQLPNKKPPLEKIRRIEKKLGKKEEIPFPSPKSTFKIPKKSSSENGMATGPRLCIRESCKQPAKTTRERGSQYCSNECLVLYCGEVFASWILDRQAEGTT